MNPYALQDRNIVINPNLAVQQIKVSKNFGRFIHPVRLLVSGPTNSGKSEFCLNLLRYRDQLFDQQFKRVSSKRAQY